MGRPNKGQHKVPRIYLQAFADSKGLVWVANNQLRLYQNKPHNILTEHDFYTIKFPSGRGSLVIETEVLGGIETAYAELYRNKIEPRKPFTDHDKAVMAVFIASMFERSPRKREALQDFFGRIKDITDKMRVVTEGMTDNERRAFADAQPYVSEESRKNSIPADELLKLGEDIPSLHSSGIPDGVATIAPIIYDMHWAFMVRSAGSKPFITSDSPVVLANPALPLRSFYQPGFAQKDVELTIPLSPDLALLAGWQLKHDRTYMYVDDANVLELNRRLIRHSETLVSDEKPILEVEVNRMTEYLKKQRGA